MREKIAISALLAIAILILVVGIVALGIVLSEGHVETTTTSSVAKPIILYVNQGNGVVDESNYNEMQAFATSQGFNTIFFQVYRGGDLLFNSSELSYFVTVTHSQGMKIFFALYFTNDAQSIPKTIYTLGEDGISLDMSTLSPATQSNLLSTMEANYHGISAVTTFDFGTSLKPQWLVLETYGSANVQYIHKGIIASVGVFDASSKQDYTQSFDYALANSDGVMVFDYATLKSTGY